MNDSSCKPTSGEAPLLVEGVDYELQVSSNGRTVWVNAADSSCIGRFDKRFGIDVHHSATAQMAGSGECIHCTHAPAGAEDWAQFRAAMRQNYGIVIAPETLEF